MTLPPLKSDTSPGSNAFSLLHEKVQRWIWEQQWTELRDAQEKAVSPILSGNTDLIISASTATGKTEAAFLPICSKLAGDSLAGVQCLYIAPLKALINDQYDRLCGLVETLEISVFKWHGDVSSSQKKKYLIKPSGILLITPESLEALFMIHGTAITTLFSSLRYVVIDELHSFIGTERGRQVQSLLHRMETVTNHRVPRIGLSATLGDMEIAKDFIRPNAVYPVLLIKSAMGNQEIQIQVRGYKSNITIPAGISDSPQPESEELDGVINDISHHLFATLRGSTNLIFTNRKADTEIYTVNLSTLCESYAVPVEFFPHHGSLSKALREETEDRLKDKSKPATAVCTSTLEMGIDIGSVKSIAQVGTPPSVASMRQRLGRSGRRSEPSIMRIYIIEKKDLDKLIPQDLLRAELFQTIAMVNLLLQGWVEAPRKEDHHFSTFIQQILSMICQYGAINALRTWKILCETGPFDKITTEMYAALLRSMGTHNLITQTSSGEIVLGWAGERLVNDYDFYSAFSTPEEYRLYADNVMLGKIPMLFPPVVDKHLIFAGRRWKITDVNPSNMTIYLIPARGGMPPNYYGSGILIEDKIRQEMFQVYLNGKPPKYLDASALQLFQEGLSFFKQFNLSEKAIVQSTDATIIFPWCGDRIMYTLELLLLQEKYDVKNDGISIIVEKAKEHEVIQFLTRVLEQHSIDPKKLAATVPQKTFEKHDQYLNDELLELNFIKTKLDIDGLYKVINKLVVKQ